ncbi:putative reverse transcriptase domain-containing protein [Tanacetum coccineum]
MEIKKVNEKVYAAQVVVNYARDLIAQRIVHSKKKEKHLKKHITLNLVYHSYNEDNIEQQLWDSTKGIMQTLHAAIKNQGASIKSISTAIDADLNPIRRIGLRRCAVSDLQESKLIPVLSQMTIPFPSRLYDDRYDEEKGSYGLKDLDAYSIGTTLRNDALPQKEKDTGSFTLPCYINNVCFEKALADLGASVSVMPFLTYTNLGLGELAHTKLTFELAYRIVKDPKGIVENVLVGIGKFIFPIDFIILDMPEDVKVPLIFERPFLSTAHAKIDVFKRKFTLRVGDEKIIFKSVKPASSLIKRVYMLSLRERMEIDLEAKLIGETLILNRSLDPLYRDYIELNDLNEPIELRRNQVDDIEPTIKEGEVIDEPMIDRVEIRCDNKIVDGLNEYHSYCDFDRKIHINYAFNLKFSCLIGYEYVDVNFFPLLSINMMTKRFYNSIMKDKVEFKGKNIVGAFVNVLIFVGKFSIMTNFGVIENMDSYRDEGMGDIIVGRPFYKEACIKANRFNGMITICKGNDSVGAQDELKGISHPCQKLKGFYKEVLNLGLEYIKNENVEEWITHGHMSIYEME